MGHSCWVCNDYVDDGLQCEGCGEWSHAKCVGFNKTVLQGIERAKNVLVRVSCVACGTNEKRRTIELKGVMNDMLEVMKNMKKELTEVKEETKEMKEEMKLLGNELKQMKSNHDATSSIPTQKMSCAMVTKNALILKSDDDKKVDEKIKHITDVLADIPIDATKRTTNGSLVLDFQKRGNMEKAKSAIESDSNLGVNARVGNMYNPKIMLPYVEDFDFDDNDKNEEDTECCKRIMETIKRKKT